MLSSRRKVNSPCSSLSPLPLVIFVFSALFVLFVLSMLLPLLALLPTEQSYGSREVWMRSTATAQGRKPSRHNVLLQQR